MTGVQTCALPISLTWKYEKEWVMTSEHAGITRDEMMVPLIIIRNSRAKRVIERVQTR